MRITLENNTLIYIYLKDENKYTENTEEVLEYQCSMLFDRNDQWIGLKILNINLDGETSGLPPVGKLDYSLKSGEILESAASITVLFDKFSEIAFELKEQCCLDMHPTGIYGIEVIYCGAQKLRTTKAGPFICFGN